MRILGVIFLLAGVAAAQCSAGSIGTNCNSPLTASGSTAAESSVGLTDNGAAPPSPAPSQYWLSISAGTIRLSANGQPYVLPGMPSNYVLLAQAGGAYNKTVPAGSTVYSASLAQIDMTLPQLTRLIIASGGSCLTCTVKAQYYNGSGWSDLTTTITPTSAAIFVTAWEALPTGANGDFQIRLAFVNSGSAQASVNLRTSTLQFK